MDYPCKDETAKAWEVLERLIKENEILKKEKLELVQENETLRSQKLTRDLITTQTEFQTRHSVESSD